MKRMKAVVFTHINPREADLADADAKRKYKARIVPFLSSYLLSNNVGLVYIYVSRGVEKLVQDITTGKRPDALALMRTQQEATGLLEAAVAEARLQMSNRRQSSSASKFEFIGVNDLAILLAHIRNISPHLLKLFAGGGRFGYDSPKFIEAVIRIVRGTDWYLCRHPIVRLDADVMVDSQAIDEVLSQVDAKARSHATFWFFSGGYRGAYANDYVNQYAVRTHWLVERNPTTQQYDMRGNGIRFLRDLGEIGATQVGQRIDCSSPCTAFVGKREYANRGVPQVISGAGLVMSLRAILRLPPFMNTANLTVWIDDHLKRRLHEAIGDIASSDLERLPNANFTQDRHPDGITQEDLNWASKFYFERLARGCLVHRTIMDCDGKGGPLSTFLKSAIISGETRFAEKDRRQLQKEFTKCMDDRLDVVLEMWSKADYGNKQLENWALGLSSNAGEKSKIVSTTVDDMLAYVELFFDWHFFTGAILRLNESDAPWLFRDPV